MYIISRAQLILLVLRSFIMASGVIHMNNITFRPGSYASYNFELHSLSFDASQYRNLSKAQDQEDIWAYENWFYGMSDGVILESGACDGLQISTTYLFEKFGNWKAIHIEANDDHFTKLIQNRKDSVNIHTVLCESERDAHFLSKGVVSGMPETMDNLYLAVHHKPIFRKQIPIQSVPSKKCMPLKNILPRINVVHIDLWILDVEGAEEIVLQGVDFSVTHINAIIMECSGTDKAKDSRKIHFLRQNDFICSNRAFAGESAFLKKSIRNRRRKSQKALTEALKPTEKNCMCLHKSFKPSSRYKNKVQSNK